MGEFSLWHWLIVLVAFVLLFGSHKLPDMARSVGRSMRILKAELGTQHDDQQIAVPGPKTADTRPTDTAPPT